MRRPSTGPTLPVQYGYSMQPWLNTRWQACRRWIDPTCCSLLPMPSRDSESSCTNCALPELGRAYDQAGQPDSALAAYQRAVDNPGGLSSVFFDAFNVDHTYRRLGELYEEKGDREKALDYYGRFTALWKDADAELQPQVREVKARMAKLAGERTMP